MNRYLVAEKFVGIQGEGVHTGTPMAFVRLCGCSVGKKTCTKCDTDFDRPLGWKGGGLFEADVLHAWIGGTGCSHVCFTGGEPLDHFEELIKDFSFGGKDRLKVHVETSGTVAASLPDSWWVCVSPKPGYCLEMIERANEIKVIVPGLGRGLWPDLHQTLAWAAMNPNVFIQPANAQNAVSRENMNLCIDIVKRHPQLRLSVQMHKFMEER